MKNSILSTMTIASISMMSLLSCNTPAEKVENAKENVESANDDLDRANKEYLVEIENYKKEVAVRVETNNKKIADFKKKIELENKNIKVDYSDKIIELERKNSSMKKKMDEYKVEAKEKWEAFKVEFSRDMDELGEAFNDLTVKNIK